ncbi:MAG: hypothetical protein SPK06_02140 [Kiritimatiellia bacterium]|nr:hypothetical protein [Kiritimatiellia bacterium]
MQAFSETLSRTGAATFQAYPTPQKDLDNFNVLNLRREEIDSNYCERHLTRCSPGRSLPAGARQR